MSAQQEQERQRQQDHVSDSSSSSSISDPLDTRDDDGWEDLEPDEESISVLSLFDKQIFPDAKSMLSYCREHHGFDIWKLRQDFDLDFLGLIKLVNYIRSEVQAGNPQPDVSSSSKFDDDKYLKPALDNDALLYSLDDVFEEAGSVGPSSEVDQLREQLANLQSHFTAYREEVQKAMLERLDSSDVTTEPNSVRPSQPKLSSNLVGGSLDNDYFKSYSYNGIHEAMIKDRIRTDAYRDFIYDHKDLFKDKVVLDVGCGTGILSMFCAKAGAKLVIAVDNSDIIDKAREHVFQNGLQSTVKCLRGKIEEVTLPVPQVDLIVSEWMGYGLLYESMLDSVIYARDKYLAPDGLMVPSHATLRIVPLADSDLKASHIDFWRDVYGFDMTAMLERAHEEVVVRVADEKELAAESCVFLELDLHTTKVEDLTFTQPFTTTWKEGFRVLEGFVVWFDIIFGQSRTEAEAGFKPGMTAAEAKQKGLVAFSTGPYSEATHWQQVIMLIKDPKDEFRAGEDLSGEVKYVRKQGQERSLEIEVSWANAQGSGKQEVKRQMWVLD
ncbi:protein arginine N-methyltransferase 3 [Capronia epimyces CBS 606.96]|uniref:type I protein arginine methyltransferase n=1 Tax=Capronia epimyces CBS 606.96 TaxID=1182542 RepID=W9Y216_9EURO|nr:protein arginine N-methyltransferase 3 [Capronia epimyces CBS 606.96]EXJ86827.1 protein arginine N-methyltransferase 3 [Capronia epimyces CBS 606.96]